MRYLVQTATPNDPRGWVTRKEYDSSQWADAEERGRRSARSYDRAGGWVRLVDSEGTLLEGRDSLPR